MKRDAAAAAAGMQQVQTGQWRHTTTSASSFPMTTNLATAKLAQNETTSCPRKRGRQHLCHNFDEIRQLFIILARIFGMNHPDIPGD